YSKYHERNCFSYIINTSDAFVNTLSYSPIAASVKIPVNRYDDKRNILYTIIEFRNLKGRPEGTNRSPKFLIYPSFDILNTLPTATDSIDSKTILGITISAARRQIKLIKILLARSDKGYSYVSLGVYLGREIYRHYLILPKRINVLFTKTLEFYNLDARKESL
ncbi:hypothetical protein N7501_008104, partial [Penicillium viridicatum]